MARNGDRSLVGYIADHYTVTEDPACAATGESLSSGDRVYLYLRRDDVEPGFLWRAEPSAVERKPGEDIPELTNDDQLVVQGRLTGPDGAPGPSGKASNGIEDVSVVAASAGS